MTYQYQTLMDELKGAIKYQLDKRPEIALQPIKAFVKKHFNKDESNVDKLTKIIYLFDAELLSELLAYIANHQEMEALFDKFSRNNKDKITIILNGK